MREAGTKPTTLLTTQNGDHSTFGGRFSGRRWVIYIAQKALPFRDSYGVVLAALRPVNVGGMVLTEVMTFFTDLNTRVAALSGFFPDAITVEELGTAVKSLDAAQVVALMKLATEARQALEQVTLATSAVVHTRSSREAGHTGLAQSLGYRTPAALIQQVTGVSRSTAMQQIRVGEALLHTDSMVETLTNNAAGVDAAGTPVVPVWQAPWYDPLTIALRSGTLSSAQHDAIKQGLGEPTVASATTDMLSGLINTPNTTPPGTTTADPVTADPATIEAWSLAATRLTDYATEVSVEELAKQARAIRDLLDPDGAHLRFLARAERRLFRMWTDSDGLTHGKFIFDDESAEWVRTIIDTALRPRRGGPRFVTVEEQTAAQVLKDDPRTNEQLTHDLLIDVLRAGAVADATTVFGVRQAGIKLVQVVNREEYLARINAEAGTDTDTGIGANTGARLPVTRLQESGITLPYGMGEKHRCNTGIQPVIVDETGDPLKVGREERLFTTKQRVALAVRDGGCRWTGCDRPASYCEAHHIDHWGADEGRTDIDRGVLLCRFHHMQLHNNKWKITRDGRGPFLLHPPPKAGAGAGAGAGVSTEAVNARILATQHATVSTQPAGVIESVQESVPEKPDALFKGMSVPTAGIRHESEPPGLVGRPESVEIIEYVESVQPIELRPPLPLTYAWQLATPPAKRFRSAA